MNIKMRDFSCFFRISCAVASVSLLGCQTSPAYPSFIDEGFEFGTGEMLDSRNFVARIQWEVLNTSNIDLCFVGLQIGIGVPFANLPQIVGSGVITINSYDTDGYDVLYIKSGESAQLVGQIDARDYVIELVKLDPDNQFRHDLGDEYMAAGSVTVFDCSKMQNSDFLTVTEKVSAYSNLNNGILGIANPPRSAPFKFR